MCKSYFSQSKYQSFLKIFNSKAELKLLLFFFLALIYFCEFIKILYFVRNWIVCIVTSYEAGGKK